MDLDQSTLQRALILLGSTLEQHGLMYELVAIGGSGLIMLGLVDRSTRDVDIAALVEGGEYVTAEPLPEGLRRARQEVAVALRLSEDWLNARPTSLLDFGLPEGFQDRALSRTYGGLKLQVASRFDQIHLKFYAAVDSGPNSRHFADLKLLNPLHEELLAAARWCVTHDPSDGFRGQMISALKELGVSGEAFES